MSYHATNQINRFNPQNTYRAAPAQTQDLLGLFQQLKICDASWQLLPPYDELKPDLGLLDLKPLLSQKMGPEEDDSLAQLIESLQKRLSKKIGQRITFYIRGSAARININQITLLDNLIEQICQKKPQHAASIQASWQQMKESLPALEKPRDLDLIALTTSPCDAVLTQIRDELHSWLWIHFPHLNAKPTIVERNLLNRTAEPLVMTKLGPNIDLAVGYQEKIKRLFSLDAQGIKIIPPNAGCIHSFQDNFFQSGLDALFKVVRVENQHLQDAYAYLAIVQNEMNGYVIVNKETSYQEVAAQFINLAPTNALLHAIKKRAEDKQLNLFSFTFNVLIRVPSSKEREALWSEFKNQNSIPQYLESDSTFEQLAQELYYFTTTSPHHPLIQELNLIFPPEFTIQKELTICKELRRKLLQCTQEFAYQNNVRVEGSPYALIASLHPPVQDSFLSLPQTDSSLTEQQIPTEIRSLFNSFPVTREEYLLTLIRNQRYQTQALAFWKELHQNDTPEERIHILAPHLPEKVLDKKLKNMPNISLDFLVELKAKVDLQHYKRALLALNQDQRRQKFHKVPLNFWKEILTDPILFDRNENKYFIEERLKECRSYTLFWTLEMQGFPFTPATAALFTEPPQDIKKKILTHRLHWLISQNRFEDFIKLFPKLPDAQTFPSQILKKVLQKASPSVALKFVEHLSHIDHLIARNGTHREEILLRLDNPSLFNYLTKEKEPAKIQQVALQVIANRRFNPEQTKTIAYTLLSTESEAKRADLFFKNIRIIPPSKEIYPLLPQSHLAWDNVEDYISWLSESGLSEPAFDLLLLHQDELSHACIKKVIASCPLSEMVPKIETVKRNELKKAIFTNAKSVILSLLAAQRTKYIHTCPQWLQEELLLDIEILSPEEAKPHLTSLLQKSKRLGLLWKMEERYGPQACECILSEATPIEEVTARLDFLLEKDRFNDYMELAKKMPDFFEEAAKKALIKAQSNHNLRGVKQVLAKSRLLPDLRWLENTARTITDERDTPIFLDLLKAPQLKKSIPDLLLYAQNLPGIEKYYEPYSQLIVTHLDSITNILTIRYFLEKAPLSITLNKEQIKRLSAVTEQDYDASLAFMHFLHLRNLPQCASLSPAIIDEVNQNKKLLNPEEVRTILLAPIEEVAKISLPLLSSILTSNNPELLKIWLLKMPHIENKHLEAVKDHHAYLLLLIKHSNIQNIEPYLDCLLHHPDLSFEEWLQLKPNLLSLKSLRLEQLTPIFQKWKGQRETFFADLHKRVPNHPCCREIIQEHLAQNDWEWFMDKPEIVNELESPLKEQIAKPCLTQLLRSPIDPKAIEKFYRIKPPTELTELFDLLQVLIRTETVNEPLLEEVLNHILRKREDNNFAANFQKFAETSLIPGVLDSTRIKNSKLLLTIQILVTQSIKKTSDPQHLERCSRWLLVHHYCLPWQDIILFLQRNPNINDDFLVLLFKATFPLKTKKEHEFMFHLAGKRQTVGYEICDSLSLLYFLNDAFTQKLPYSIYKGIDNVLLNPLLRNGGQISPFVLEQLRETPAPTLQQILAVLDGGIREEDKDLRTKFFQLFARLLLFKISPETILVIDQEDDLETVYRKLKQLILANNLQNITAEYLADVLNTPDCLNSQIRLGNVTDLYVRILPLFMDSPESYARFSPILFLLIENTCKQFHCNNNVLNLMFRPLFEKWKQNIPPTVNRTDHLLCQFIVDGTFKDIQPSRDEAFLILNKVVEICRPHRTCFHAEKIYQCIQLAHQFKLEEKLIQKWIQIANVHEQQLVDTDKHYLVKLKERISKGNARLAALLKTKRK